MKSPPWILVGPWVLTVVLGVALFGATTSHPAGTPYLADLQIYRESVRSAAQGGSLFDFVFYDPRVRAEGFGFTYPPFAALAFWPLTWLPVAAGEYLWTALSLFTTAAVGSIVAFHSTPGSRRRVVISAGICTLALLASYPIVSDVILGQTSLFVMALTLVDAVLIPRRWRGWLTAVSGAIKLLPLIFIPYFLVTRQWAAAVRATVGFLAATGLAFLVLPADSIEYWTRRLWETSHVGDAAGHNNRALYGMLLRWLGEGALAKAIWASLVALLAVAAVRAIRRHHRASQDLEAATVVGCLAIAVFPISWTHYLIWALVAGFILLTSGRGWPAVGLIALLALSLPSPLMSEGSASTLMQSVGQELPGLFVAAVAAFGLPQRPALASPIGSTL